MAGSRSGENHSSFIIMLTILTIAGYDPSAGAGVAADLKTIGAFGGYGIGAITSLTFQNTLSVKGAVHSTAAGLEGQLTALLEDFTPAAVKTGMLPTPETIETTAEILTRYEVRNLVVDPVIRSTSGFDLIDDQALQALISRLLPLATLITPNLMEAERLVHQPLRTLEERKWAAAKIHQLARLGNPPEGHPGNAAVLLKGGHLAEEATDLLYDGGSWTLFPGQKIETRHTHGTGCTLSAAIATLLGQGYPLQEAIARAKAFVTEAIRTAPGLGHGAGPLNHLIDPQLVPPGEPPRSIQEERSPLEGHKQPFLSEGSKPQT